MKDRFKKPSAIFLALAGIIGRLAPHLPNMTPVGATALFSGATLKRPWSYLLPLGVMFVTDLFLGIHATLPYVYFSFVLSTFLGEWFLAKNSSLIKVGLLGIINSAQFFVITNFGVWASTPLYQKTLAGLVKCYIMGLPFLRGTVLGDVIFSVGIFAIYQWASSRDSVKILDQRLINWFSNN